MILKELYIDSFDFKPLKPESKAENFICRVFNNKLIGIIFDTNSNDIDFIHEEYYISYYDVKNKNFHLSPTKIGIPLMLKFNVDFYQLDELCIPIFKQHLLNKLYEVNSSTNEEADIFLWNFNDFEKIPKELYIPQFKFKPITQFENEEEEYVLNMGHNIVVEKHLLNKFNNETYEIVFENLMNISRKPISLIRFNHGFYNEEKQLTQNTGSSVINYQKLHSYYQVQLNEKTTSFLKDICDLNTEKMTYVSQMVLKNIFKIPVKRKLINIYFQSL